MPGTVFDTVNSLGLFTLRNVRRRSGPQRGCSGRKPHEADFAVLWKVRVASRVLTLLGKSLQLSLLLLELLCDKSALHPEFFSWTPSLDRRIHKTFNVCRLREGQS